MAAAPNTIASVAGRRSRLNRWLLGPGLPAAVALLCYANSLGNGFAYDDLPIVQENRRIRSLVNLPAIWLTNWWQPSSDADAIKQDPTRDRLYRPLTLQTFALNYAVHGVSPFGYHLVNVLLHGAVCVLVWRFVRRVLGDDAVALLASMLFAVHPVHVEAVAGIVGRAETLAALFLLTGLLVLAPSATRPGAGRALIAAVAFLAALLSKETAICFVPVALLVLHTLYRADRPSWRWWAGHAAALLLPLLVYFPLRYAALEQHLVRDPITWSLQNPLHEAEPQQRAQGALTILGHYTRLMLFPLKLSCDYGYRIIDPHAPWDAMTFLGLATAAGMLAALWGYLRPPGRWRQVAGLTAMLLASYALISNAVILIGVSLAERLIYWPSLFVLAAIALGAVEVWRRLAASMRPAVAGLRWLSAAGAVAALGALSLRTYARTGDWHDNVRLFEADVATYPEGSRLLTFLASVRIKQADELEEERQREALLTDAGALLDRALHVTPRSPEALRYRGLVYQRLGQLESGRGNAAQARQAFEQAQQYAQEALQAQPEDRLSQQLLTRLRQQHVRAEDRARVKELRAAVQQRPRDLPLRLELAGLLLDVGRRREALEHYQRAYRQAPENLDAIRGYAEALLLGGKDEEAQQVLQRLLSRQPNNAWVLINLARLLADDDPALALRYAWEAYQMRPNDPHAALGLADALCANGQDAEALRVLQRLEQKLPASDPTRTHVTERIRRLQRGRP